MAHTSVRGDVTKVSATLTAAAEDNGSRLKCDATNAALPTPLTALSTLSMLCEFTFYLYSPNPFQLSFT